MAKGESLEALLSPQLRVSRPVAACSRCRSAKIKCDGKLPACTACERAGKADSCSGANDDFAKGKERSYVAALEAASERLEKRIKDTKVLQATDPSNRDAAAASHLLGPDHLPQPPRRIASGSRVHRKEASDVDNLVGDFGFLSVNATSRDFHGFTSTMSFARLLLAVSQSGDPLPVVTRNLPARHIITPLFQKYLDDVFVLLPFFSETDFMASVSAVYAGSTHPAKPTDQWMVRMVLATAAAISSRERGDEYWRLAQEYVSAALYYAENVLHPGSIAGLQAILLLVQYSMVDPEMFSCWHLIGFASRVVVDLGLHNEPAAEVRISKEENEMRRRVFYSVYTLDRNISMAFDRAFSFTDDSALVNLPVLLHSTTASDPDQNSGPQLFLRSLQPSLYLFDIRRVQSTLYQETHLSNRSPWPAPKISSYTNSILADVRSWASSIPDTLAKGHTVLFRLESLYTQIVALAPSCRNPNITEISRLLLFEYATEYAEQLHPIIRDSNRHAFYTVTDVHRINFIGHQFLGAMRASFDHLLSGIMPRESPASSPKANEASAQAIRPPSPKISRSTSPLENSIRAIRFLKIIVDVFAYAHRRFGSCCLPLKLNFEQESAVLMNKLKLKQQELGTVQYITGGPPGRQQQQQQWEQQLREISRLHSLPAGAPSQPIAPFRGFGPIHESETRANQSLLSTLHRPPLWSAGPGPSPYLALTVDANHPALQDDYAQFSPPPLWQRPQQQQQQPPQYDLTQQEQQPPPQYSTAQPPNQHQQTLPPIGSSILVSNPVSRALTYQPDLLQRPGEGTLPHAWLMSDLPQGTWGPPGQSQMGVPPQDWWRQLSNMPEISGGAGAGAGGDGAGSGSRRAYEFVGTEQGIGAGDGSGGVGDGIKRENDASGSGPR